MHVIVSAWYRVKNKLNSYTKYQQWMQYFFMMTSCLLIVFTNQESLIDLEPYKNQPNVILVMKELPDFYVYRYLQCWQNNNTRSKHFKPYVSTELNMLWNEKVRLVWEVATQLNIQADWYMWCDIGYFRLNEPLYITEEQMRQFPSREKVSQLNPDKVYIGLVAKPSEAERVGQEVQNRCEYGLPRRPDRVLGAEVIAGGFFAVSASLVEWWYQVYYAQLERYLCHGYYVADDQLVMADVVLNHLNMFELVAEYFSKRYNHWMMFQTFLLDF
jgi:hypothetical protein